MKEIVRNEIDKIFFISDIHMGMKNASIEWNENILSYFREFFFPLVKRSIIEGFKPGIIIAGDFFDNRQTLDISVMNDAISLMKEMSSICEIFIVIGNHDIYKKQETDVTSLAVFRDMNNVNVIDDIATLSVSGKKLLLISWVGDNKKENELIAKNKSSVDFIVLHTELSGMSYDNGREIVDGVDTKTLSGKKVYSGHIHKRQESKKAVYLGSPYATTRADIGNTKGVYAIEILDDKAVEKFYENTFSPVFLKYTYDEVLSMDKNTLTNNYVDIVIKESVLDKINLSKFIESLDEYNPRKVEMFTEKDVTDNIEVSDEIEDKNVEDIFTESVDIMNLSDEDMEKLKKMNQLYINMAAKELGL